MIKKLPDWAQAAGALLGAFSAGVLLAAFPGIPTRVEANTSRLAMVESAVARVEDKVDRVVCLLQLPDDGEPFLCQ